MKILQVITFDISAKKQILAYFDKMIKDKFIIEKNSKDKVLSFDGNEILSKEFGGIVIGSEIYIKSDIDSIVKLIEYLPHDKLLR